MTTSFSKADAAALLAQGFLQNQGGESFSGRILTKSGRLTAEQVIGLAEAARKFGSGQVSFTTRLNVEIPGIPYGKIPAFKEHVAACGLVTGGTGPKVRPVLSCKGGVCRNGLFDTFGLAGEITERFVAGFRDLILPNKLKIGVGGCPNNCAKPDLNDVGVSGRMKPVLDKEACTNCPECLVQAACQASAVTAREEGPPIIDEARCLECGRCVSACLSGAVTGRVRYEFFLGGRWGKLAVPGRPLNRDFETWEEVLAMIGKVIRLVADRGLKGERVSGVVERLGFAEVEKALLG